MAHDKIVDTLKEFGRKCKIEPKMRLSASKKPMCMELRKFFKTIIYIIEKRIYIGGKQINITYKKIATALDCLGVQSADGHKISDSHVSNAVRKSIKNIGPFYEKPNYKGKNHFSFNSKSTPFKIDFAQASNG